MRVHEFPPGNLSDQQATFDGAPPLKQRMTQSCFLTQEKHLKH